MKKWKLVQLVGVLVLLLGVVIRAGTGEMTGTGLAVIGVLVFAVGRVAAWLRSDTP
jgi:hypothetical protein